MSAVHEDWRSARRMGGGAQARPPLRTQLADLGFGIINMMKTRVELAGAELLEERDALLRRVVLGVAAFVCALMAGFAGILAIAFAVPEDSRPLTLGIVFLVLVAIVAGCVIAVRRQSKNGRRLFGRLADQLSRDRDVLWHALKNDARTAGRAERPAPVARADAPIRPATTRPSENHRHEYAQTRTAGRTRPAA